MQHAQVKSRNRVPNELSSLRLRLKNIEERDNWLFERNPAFSVVIETDGKIKNANKAFLKNLDYLKSEIVGQPLINFIAEDQRTELLAQFKECFNGDLPAELEIGIYAKSGSVKTALFSSTRLLFQEEMNPQSILVSGVDISARKEVEIKNGKNRRDLEQLAFTDSLTGVFNHRYFMRILEHEVARSQRYGKPKCLLMYDVDDFKSYNDTYGHLEGDRVLNEVSQTIKRELRRVDVICRYGGDEFVIILPETSISQAEIVAEKIKKVVSNLRFRWAITLSIGIAANNKDMKARELILKADHALYQAKGEGKDGACCLV